MVECRNERFYAGPDVHIVDMIALAEPLLARLPAKYDPVTGAGHYGRIMPAGYLEMLAGEEVAMADTGLAKYRDKLQKVISGPLCSRERFTEIWRLNTGNYDAVINWDFYRFPPPLEEALAAKRIRPGRPDIYIHLAELLLAEDRSVEAVAALNAALANNPRSFNNVYLVADMLRKHGLQEQSRAAYARALHLAPAYLAGLEREQNYFEAFHALRRMALAHRGWAKRGMRLKWPIYLQKCWLCPRSARPTYTRKSGILWD